MKTFLTHFFTRTVLVCFSIFIFSAITVESRAQGCTSPRVFNVSGGCVDEPVNLSGSETGVTYRLLKLIPGEFVAELIATLEGTGEPLSFNSPFDIGTYFVVATNACSPPGGVNMTGMVTVGIHPQVFDVTGGCTGSPINLSGSQINVTYHLMAYDGFSNIEIAELQGTGGAISFSPPFNVGSHFVVATSGDCSPGIGMNGIINVSSPPQVFNVTGGCPGDPVNLSGSEAGVTYHLWTLDLLGNNVQVAELPGTGDAISFDPPFNLGRPYFVIATNACSPNGTSMNGILIMSNPPQVFNVSGGGCPGNPINLSGSEIGVTYHLINSVNYGQQVVELQGTGEPLSFNASFSPGIYNVIATNSCKPLGVVMNGTVPAGFTPTFYRDADGDGYGNPNITEQSCTQPTGYVNNNSDCDDTNSVIHPEATEICDGVDNDCDGEIDEGVKTTFYRDQDGDGYGDLSVTTEACSVPDGYVANNTDCYDHNGSVHESFVFYRDQDGDGYGSVWAKGQELCAVDASTPPEGFSANNTDCDDEDLNIWRSALLYIDQDADGYDNGQEEICYGANVPAGYSLTTNGPDCDDSKGNMHESFVFYRDQDGDGYGSVWAKGQELCAVDANTPTEGFSANNTDCDDEDPNIWRSALLYIDQDADGYDNGQEETCYGANVPTGYSITTNGPDCDDSKGSVHEAFIFYIDGDGDGYGGVWAKGQELCAEDANTPPDGFSTNNTDCDDDDPDVWQLALLYIDQDADGYDNGQEETCYGAIVPTGYSLTTNGPDCDDGNDKIYPGAPEICNGIDDNCNGTIDEQACICQNATNLSTTDITCNSATFNWVAYTNPTQWELEYKSTSNGSKWINVPLPNASSRSVNITGLKPNQNYQWHIRAKCGRAWTLFSGLVLFKTLATCTTSADLTRSTNTAKPEGEISGKSENMKVGAMPNPSNTNFRITLNSNNLKEPVKIIITDMLGKVIETRTTNAGQIIIGEKYRSGTYLVRIIQGKESRQLKLIKLPD